MSNIKVTFLLKKNIFFISLNFVNKKKAIFFVKSSLDINIVKSQYPFNYEKTV